MENNKEENLEKSKKEINIKLKTIIIIGIIVAIAIVGIIVYVITQNIKTNSTNNSTIIKGTGSNEIILSNPIAFKPIIYLYPEDTTELSVILGKPEKLTCSYPEYKNGWNLIAHHNGSLIDTNTGRKLYSLYWEGIHSEPINLEEGFVVEGNNTVEFLEEKLEILGLNEFEAEEFIIYWLPKLQENEYNYIRFATIDEINKNMPLKFSVEPDTIIRVLMQYKALDKYINVNEQKLETPKRAGFVAVEWGGTEIK